MDSLNLIKKAYKTVRYLSPRAYGVLMYICCTRALTHKEVHESSVIKHFTQSSHFQITQSYKELEEKKFLTKHYFRQKQNKKYSKMVWHINL